MESLQIAISPLAGKPSKAASIFFSDRNPAATDHEHHCFQAMNVRISKEYIPNL
jgi:hypothetical protein